MRPEIPGELYETLRKKLPEDRNVIVEIKLQPDNSGAFLKLSTLDDNDSSLDYFPIQPAESKQE
jgi:hypothetical protein